MCSWLVKVPVPTVLHFVRGGSDQSGVNRTSYEAIKVAPVWWAKKEKRMCNPRRVMIHLARSIEQAWRQTVEQTATAGDEVTELARINAQVNLDEEMGDAALQVFERVLAGEFEGFEKWTRDSVGHYRRDLGQVTLVYDPDNHRLTVEAQLTELVTAEARATAEASGFTVGEVAVEAMGHYYDDGWGGRTRERALEEAEGQAEKRLKQAIDALHREQHAKELSRAEDEAQKKADDAASQELTRLQAETRSALRTQLQVVLAQAEEQVYHVMNRAVGEAYRQTLHQLVENNGGRVITDERTGSVINMELELY